MRESAERDPARSAHTHTHTQCRVANLYMPWTCKHERHEFEVCQYREYLRRVKKMEMMKKEESLAKKQKH